MVAGIVAAIASLLVGIFPMDKLQPHIIVATTYYRAGLASVVLFSIVIALQPANHRVIPLYALVFRVIGTTVYTIFLVYAGQMEKKQKANALDSQQVRARPRFWLMPFLEWMVVISTLLWYLVICTVR